MICLGSVPAGTTIYVPFTTYAGSTGASVTCTGLAVTDIEIYKNGSTTQRSSDAGYTLLDTDGIDFDSITGLHGFSIDLNDNTDAGFYAVGSWYWVVVSAITVDSQTVTFLAAVFRICPAESITGYPKIDVHGLKGDAQSATDLQDFADAGYDPATNKVQGVVLADTVTTTTTTTNLTNLPTIPANWITAAGVAADAVTEIQAGLSTLDAAGVRTAIGLASANLDTQIGTLATAANLATVAGYLDTEIAAILADTNELQTDWTNGGRLDLILDTSAADALKAADRSGYVLALAGGAIANPQTATETFVVTTGGNTFTVTGAGITSTGGRSAPTLAKT